MSRLLVIAVLLLPAGCSNAPLAGTLDAVWPARGGAAGGGLDTPPDNRPPIVPDVRPATPGSRPTPRPAGPGATDALPPPADFGLDASPRP